MVHFRFYRLWGGLAAALAFVNADDANASVVTIAQFSGEATTTNLAGEVSTRTYDTSGTADSFVNVTPLEEVSSTNVFGTIETNPDGTLNFSNAVGGLGRGSSAFSQTTVRQTVTNTTGSAQNVSFESVVLPGSVGMWLFDNNECDPSSVFNCSEVDPTPGLPPLSLSDVGGPASSSLSMRVLANGVTIFDLAISIGVTETGLYEIDVSDGSALNGFGQLGDPSENLSLFFAWDQTDLSVDIGTLGAGEEVIIDFVVETAFSNGPDCPFETTCVGSLSGFGDPIKSTGGAQTDRFALQSFMRSSGIIPAPEISFTPLTNAQPVPLPAAAWLFAGGFAALWTGARRREQSRS